MSIQLTDQPAIYVGTYEKYNDGNLFGAWFQLDRFENAEAFWEAARALHRDEADPELMFQDWQSIPEGMVGESHTSDDLWPWLKLDAETREIVRVYRKRVNAEGSIADALDAFSGQYKSRAAFAERDFEDQGLVVPEHLQGFVDWDRMALSLESGGVTFALEDGKLWVFA